MKKKAVIYTEDTKNLLELSEFLISNDWEILSAGKTASFLQEKNIPITIEEGIEPGNNFSKILNMILDNSNLPVYREDVEDSCIKLVCINIKPEFKPLNDFLEIESFENCIDFNHISLLRAAAKNYSNVIVLSDPDDYKDTVINMKTDNLNKDFRLYLAGKALNLTSAYDSAACASILIQTVKMEYPNYYLVPYKKVYNLNYGMNPHQSACFYSIEGNYGASSGFKRIGGDKLSLGMIQNFYTAWKGISLFFKTIKNPFNVETFCRGNYSFTTQFTPAAGSVFTLGIKNSNPIGAALGMNVLESYKKTFDCEPAAFENAVLGCSAVIDAAAAEEMLKTNLQVIVAPDFTKDAHEIFSRNKDLRLITASKVISGLSEMISIDDGLLVQSPDNGLFDKWHVVTKKRPSQIQIDAMAFGMMIALIAKSDCGVVVKDSAAIGLAAGYTDTVKALKAVLEDTQEYFENNNITEDKTAEILVSDSSIPFNGYSKCIEELSIKAIIQTGGDKDDQKFIDFCDERDITMVFTGVSHIAF